MSSEADVSLSVPVEKGRPGGWVNSRRTWITAIFVVPALFGLFSVILGADTNWDNYNYHRYNAFALLHGKLGIDLAPAGMQGYFNPFLDLPAYWLNLLLPPWMAGFALGALHGFAFVIVLGIARIVLAGLPQADAYRVPLLLAVAGCLTPNFLSGIGNGMGDNFTALFTLASLWFLLSRWAILAEVSVAAVAALLFGGLVVGLGVGLKLTNAVFAVGLCAALVLCYPGGLLLRLRLGFVFGLGVLAGIAATGGYWMFRLWQAFGNPFFPQFGAIFPNPLAQPIAVGDTRWLPQGLLEVLAWPFLFTIDVHRVGELSIHQLIWPAVYVLFFAWAGRSLWKRAMGRDPAAKLDPRTLFLLAFIAVSYLVWMKLFSIIRYVVAMEMLVPLAIFILLTRLVSYAHARRLTGWGLSLAIVFMIVSGTPNWGHESWSNPLYRVEEPDISEPGKATVLLVTSQANAPLGWLVASFPPEVSFIGLENSFPATPAFVERARAMAQQRGGPIYVITSGATDRRAAKMAVYNDVARFLGLTQEAEGCARLRAIVGKLRLRAEIEAVEDGSASCRVVPRAGDRVNIDDGNRALVDEAEAVLTRSGFALDRGSCRTYDAGIGGGSRPYQFCRAGLVSDN
ncbi:hypothetical protein [Rhizobium sp. BK251]|uniref:hypothetical protein n=1 Tax=Rhizobium sp. BK251 TaxID=2512125 RepID=UPI0010D9F86A|nr:hypothetical protein [Rhizobium sp. BK251]TCL73598.1 hypothetical protein EV286_103127 [Rhizobium sp. BK251]